MFNKALILILIQLFTAITIAFYMLGIPPERSISAIIVFYAGYKMFAGRLISVPITLLYFFMGTIGMVGLFYL